MKIGHGESELSRFFKLILTVQVV